MIVVGRSVGRLICFSARFLSNRGCCIDAKRGYVGMCNGRSAQQESGAALSENRMFTTGAKNYIQLLY